MMAAWQIAAQVGLVSLVLLLAFVLLVRPQLKRIADHKAVMQSLKVGDEIVMRGGLIGTIASFDDSNVVTLALCATTSVRIDRNSIERRSGHSR
jgi:preprotein translocase subunit YajC